MKEAYRMTKLTEIHPYERNPRVIPQAAVDAVARSIQAFGFRAPIVVDANGVILAGHTRYRAAQQLGLDVVPVVWQSDITDIQARGYRIADNKVSELSAWDRDALDFEVRELAQNADADLEALGLSQWELDRILQDCGTSPTSAFRQLEEELLSSEASAPPKPSEGKQQVCNGAKPVRILVTLPSGVSEDMVAQFLARLTEMLSDFPGSRTETF